MTIYIPGKSYPLQLLFQDDTTGTATDPASIQLDITYGSEFGTGPDFAGPFSFSGATTPTPGQVYRTALGAYQFDWTIPSTAPGGVYIANWTIGYNGRFFPGRENLDVSGGASITPPVNGDLGIWSGSLTYGTSQIMFGAQDLSGTAWTWLGIDGMDGAPTDGQVVQRGSDHGGYATPQVYGPRPITLRARAVAITQAERDMARAALQQVVPVNDLGTLVYNETVPKTLQVRRSGVVKEVSQTLIDVSFSIPMIAPDPRKYGASYSQTVNANSQMLGFSVPVVVPIVLPAQAPPGALTLINNGNFETRPLITISGPITAPGVYNQSTGEQISFSTLTLGVSDTLVIDLLNKVALLDGAGIPADLWSAWFVCQPGQSQIVLQGSNSGGATMTIAYQDAWM